MTRWIVRLIGKHAPLAVFVALLGVAGPRAIAQPGDAGSPAEAGAAQPDPQKQIESVRQDLSQWVKIQQQISKARRDWQLARRMLNERIDLLKREIADVRDSIDQTEAKIAETDAEYQKLQRQKRQREAALDTVRQAIVELESRTRQLLKRLPAPLRKDVKPLSQSLPEDSQDSDQRLTTRFQNVIGILNRAHTFNSEMNATQQRIELPSGGTRSVRVLYLGLGQAFYVSADETVAGVGTATREGWKWKARNQAAPQIAKVHAIFSEKELASFVPVPVSVQGQTPKRRISPKTAREGPGFAPGGATTQPATQPASEPSNKRPAREAAATQPANTNDTQTAGSKPTAGGAQTASAAPSQTETSSNKPAATQPRTGKAASTQPALPATAEPFAKARAGVANKVKASQRRLSQLQKRIQQQKLPLTKKLSNLEQKLRSVRAEHERHARKLDQRTLDLRNLKNSIDQAKNDIEYFSRNLSTYTGDFSASLHIAETQRYKGVLEDARLAPDNDKLSQQAIFQAQFTLVQASIDRLQSALGGARFDGQAVDNAGQIHRGQFVVLGPVALFAADDANAVGLATQSLNEDRPVIQQYGNPRHTEAAHALVAKKGGQFPFDPTLGQAAELQSAEGSLWQYAQQGGPVMVPIVALAAISLLVALGKWIALLFVRKPPQKQISELLKSIARRDDEAARKRAARIKGPVGAMLATGVEHMAEPRELIEEVMYEKVLATRLKAQRFLPFISVTAASAPLLGLLGTVIGIINTFQVMNVSGSGGGDMQALAGGISEALVTTASGLIVAIPSLLLYAFLSRKARAVTDQMEQAALSFTNQVVLARVENQGVGAADS